MIAAITVIVLLGIIALGVWILRRLGVESREGIATHHYGRPAPGGLGPRPPELPPTWNGAPHGPPRRPPQAARPHAVHTGHSVGDDRRDHRDGGRGRGAAHR